MKTKKILSITLAILMLLGTFAVGASAAETEIKSTDIIIAGNIISGLEESYWLTVDGALTSDGASASNYNIAITPASTAYPTRVTLNNAELSKISTIEKAYYVIASLSSLDIMLQGKNTFEVLPEEYAQIVGLFSDDALRIFGNGSLTMNLGNKNTVYVNGISGNTVDITGSTVTTLNLSSIYTIDGGYSLYETTVTDNANLIINEYFLENKAIESEDGYEESDLAEGVKATGYETTYNGFILSDNAKVTVNMINTDSVKNVNQGLIIKGNIELWTNSHITVNGTDGKASAGIGMNNGDIVINGTSSITAKAGNADEDLSYGIYLYNGKSNKQYVTLSDSAKITATAGNAVTESFGLCAYAELTATDNACIIATAGNVDKIYSKSAGAYFTSRITLSDEAQLTGKCGNSSDESYGIYSKNIVVSDDAQLTGESKGSTKEESIGVYAVECFEAYGNAVVNAKGGNANTSYGLSSEEIKIHGSAKIDAVASDSEGISAGIYTDGETFTVSDNATVTAKGGKALESGGIAAVGEGVISGNAVVVAEASEGTEYSVGFATGHLNVKDNANIKATASASDKYSYGIIGFDISINDCATVEAAGDNSAFFSDLYEIVDYKDLYIAVSTDKNPENAVEYDNSNHISAYEDANDVVHDSIYKYLLITSGAPEEPEPELNFFEQLIVDIVEFFDGIKAFFESLFSFLG